MAFLLQRRWPLAGALLALLTTLAGCSTGTRIAYNNLDTLASWQLADYVTLRPDQKVVYKATFQSTWDWHRQTQLPLYAQDLRAMASAVQRGPLSQGAIDGFIAKVERHGDVLGNRLLDGLTTLLPALDDAQVMQIVAEQRRKIMKDERKRADESPAQRQKRYEERVAEATDRWIGELTAPQKERVERAWLDGQATRPTPARRQQNRLDDLQHFAALLATRQAPDFGARLRAFSDEDDNPQRLASERGKEEVAEEARQKKLMTDILLTLDPVQRTKLHDRLQGLAEDCDALAPARVASEGSRLP